MVRTVGRLLGLVIADDARLEIGDPTRRHCPDGWLVGWWACGLSLKWPLGFGSRAELQVGLGGRCSLSRRYVPTNAYR